MLPVSRFEHRREQTVMPAEWAGDGELVEEIDAYRGKRTGPFGLFLAVRRGT